MRADISRRVLQFGEQLLTKFIAERTTTMAASLAYYTVLSLAPLLILFASVASRIDADLQQDLVNQARGVIGDNAALSLEMVLDNAKNTPARLASLSDAFGVLTLLLAASLVFGELRADLDQIFKVEHPPTTRTSVWREVFCYLREKVFQISFALMFLAIITFSLLLTAFLHTNLSSHLHLGWRGAEVISSFAAYVTVFTLMYRFLPNHSLPWWQALRGGALTATLFALGKEGIGIYLQNNTWNSAYGATGSIIALLIWVYYSSLITFLGAEVSSILEPEVTAPT